MVTADPVTGAVLRDGGAYRIDLKYAQANAVWRANRRLVELTAAARPAKMALVPTVVADK